MPSAAARLSARISLVQPGSVPGDSAMSGRTGSRLAYRHMLGGPDSMSALARLGKS